MTKTDRCEQEFMSVCFLLCKSGNKKAERDFTTTLRANLNNQ